MINEGIGMLKKLSNYFPRYSLVTLYKAFIRSHIDYVDVIYEKPNNMNICNNLAAIIWVIRGSSKEKLYLELGFEYLNLRRQLRKLCLIYEAVVNKSPRCFQQLINPIKLEAVANFYICVLIFSNISFYQFHLFQ